MTFKLLSSNLNRENPRRRVAFLLTFLFCVIFVIYSIIFVQNEVTGGGFQSFTELRNDLITIVRPSFYLVFMALFLGLLLSCSSFSYLHSKKEVDFYHALPQTRKQMFLSLVLPDMFFGTLAMTATVLLRSLATVFANCFCAKLVSYTISSILCGTVLFLLFYLTMLAAILLTGHIIVSFLGFGVFCTYVPLGLANLYPFLGPIFYDTFDRSYITSDLWNYFSPVSLGLRLASGSSVWSFRYCWRLFAACCIWCVILLIINQKLFGKRRLECAGNAMAFARSKPVIRILLVIPLSLYTGIFLYNSLLTPHKWLVVAGVVAGTVFFHGMIESIYQFDIRGIFRHKKQLLGCIIFGLGIMTVFYLDLTGFDSYLPESENLSSVMISKNYTIDLGMTETDFWGTDQKGIQGKELDVLLPVLEDIVNTSHTTKEMSGADLAMDPSQKEDPVFYSVFHVNYYLKNKSQKTRIYYVNAVQAERLCKILISSMDYKKSVNSLYTADLSGITDIQLCGPAENITLKLSGRELSEFISIYLEEYSRLDYDTYRREAPFSYLSIESLPGSDDGRFNHFASYVRTSSYWIYPSFTNTVSYLESKGYHVTASIDDFEITSVELSQYDDVKGSSTSTIKDAREIEKRKETFHFGECASDCWGFYDVSSANICLNAIDKKTGKPVEISVYTDMETLEDLKKL